MTDKPTPKEIDLLVRAYLGDCGPQANRVYSFVTAVLAKWGQPAPAPQPVALEPLSHAQAKALVLKYGNDPLNLVFQVELAHGIRGGQHGTE